VGVAIRNPQPRAAAEASGRFELRSKCRRGGGRACRGVKVRSNYSTYQEASTNQGAAEKIKDGHPTDRGQPLPERSIHPH